MRFEASGLRRDCRSQFAAKYCALGCILGFTLWKFQEQIAAGQVQIKQSPNPVGLTYMVLSGYIDAANMEQQVAHYHLKQKGQPNSLVMLLLQDSHDYLSSTAPEIDPPLRRLLARERKAAHALKIK